MTDADLVRLIARVGYNPLGDEDGSTHTQLLRIADRLTTPAAITHEPAA